MDLKVLSILTNFDLFSTYFRFMELAGTGSCQSELLSFPAHGPKRAYVALCALYPVCAELFLPYESSADRRPATKPKPLAYYVESLQGQRNRQEYSIFCFTPSPST